MHDCFNIKDKGGAQLYVLQMRRGHALHEYHDVGDYPKEGFLENPMSFLSSTYERKNLHKKECYSPARQKIVQNDD